MKRNRQDKEEKEEKKPIIVMIASCSKDGILKVVDANSHRDQVAFAEVSRVAILHTALHR